MVLGTRGEVFIVNVNWNDGAWNVNTWQLDNEWNDGNQFGSRNQRVSPS